MDEVVALQQVDAVVVPLVALGHTHVGGDHDKAFAVIAACDIGIALSAFDAGMLLGVHDRLSADDVFVVVAVAADGIGCPFALVAHVAVEVAIVALDDVLCGDSHGHDGQDRGS